ncbi:uncharacterized protein DS421_20g689300 [Arachis hypogaea]|nr:uncharacterized protein DS421_20g689300 [Arachis hypogaea]
MVTTATMVSRRSNGDDGGGAGSDEGWRAPLQWQQHYFLSLASSSLALSSSYDSLNGDTTAATVAVTSTGAVPSFPPLLPSPSSLLELHPFSFLSFSFRVCVYGEGRVYV